MAGDAAIILMAKQPEVGKTKTRLCPPLQPDQAAALYEALLCDTIHRVTGLAASGPPAPELAIAITPASARAYFEGITPRGTYLVPVDGPDIGVCLAQALEALLHAGYRKALALNTDGPSLPPAYLEQAIAALDEHDLVLGPADDGGYYLVGLKEMDRRLFAGIPWSTPQVLRQTLELATRLGRRAWLAPPWYDVDSPGDLQRLQSELSGLPGEQLPFIRRFLAKFNLPILRGQS